MNQHHISRRQFFKNSAVVAAAVAAGPYIQSYAEQAVRSQSKKPNIIYILADDLGYADVGFNGQKIIKTPCLDKMRSEGMNFTQHYSGSAVCAPSRACIITGQHTGHTTVRDNGWQPLSADDASIAQVMKKAGYVTGCIGKWGLGGSRNTGGPNKKGFDFFYGFEDQKRANNYYPEYLIRNGEKVNFPDNSSKKTHYCHDLFTEEAIKFIKKNKDNPFFLYLPYTIAHKEMEVPADSLAQYKGKIGPEKPYKRKGGTLDTPHATFAGMVSRMDRDIGRILDLLKEQGIDENTLVIFSSDNGPTGAGGSDPGFFNGNGDFRGAKGALYEGGIRMPFVAWWPGKIQPNSTSDHPSAFWDLMPTACELGGIEPPADTDGISYVQSLLSQPDKQKKHEYLYWELGKKQAIRKGNWKGVRLNVDKDRKGPLELYDLEKDPGETKNLAKDHPEIVKELAALMESGRTEGARPFPRGGGKKKKDRKEKGKKK